MDMNYLFLIILTLVHSLVGLWYAVKSRWCRLKMALTITSVKLNRASLTNRLRQLNKLPNSIAIIAQSYKGEGESSEKQGLLEKSLIIYKWASSVGVGHISFYDPDGFFESEEAYVKQRVKLLLPETQSNCVKLSFLSSKHSKDHVVRLCQELVNESKSKVDKFNNTVTASKYITQNELEKRINDDFDSPEPDLVIEMTEAPCLLGFHPWRIKLSEIILLPECDAADEVSVLNSLVCVFERYNKCEKRVGR